MIKVLTINEDEQWDRIVRSFKMYDVYWLSGYVRAFYLHGDGEPLLFYYESENTRGINVVMKRDIADDKHFCNSIPHGQIFDFSTPYGYGGWIIEGENINDLIFEYAEWNKKHCIISEFVRFHPIIKNHIKVDGAYDVIKLGEVVHMDLDNPDAIWENITSKNRNMIRKAKKNGVKIYNGRFPKIYEQFMAIYNTTMDKDCADNYYYFNSAFYESLLYDLPENAEVFWAEKDGLL